MSSDQIAAADGGLASDTSLQATAEQYQTGRRTGIDTGGSGSEFAEHAGEEWTWGNPNVRAGNMTGQLSFQDAVRRRRSVRKFETGRSIGKDVLARIVDCGRWAPSGANVQCWEFVVVDEPTMREAVTAVFLRQAERLVETLSLTPIANPPGILEGQADFSAPRVAGKATKGRRKK